MHPDDRQVWESIRRCIPLIVTIVAGTGILRGLDYASGLWSPELWTEEFQNTTRCIFGAFVYREMVFSGLVDHLNDPHFNTKKVCRGKPHAKD